MTGSEFLVLPGSEDLAPAPVPLIVDVDGTLLRSDLLQESALQFVARHPLETPRMLGWLMKGRSRLQANLADRVDPGVEAIPLRTEVLALIRGAQAEGRPVYLASASDRRCVEVLAARIGGVRGVFATDRGVNLAGSAKADRLVSVFGIGGYDYIGDRPVDFPVWRSARRVLVVSRDEAFSARVTRQFPRAEIVATPRSRAGAYLKAVRPHQWAKNTLLFLPMAAGHDLDTMTILASFAAFTCFCAAASSAYIINDLLDLPGDRDHPTKNRRPFAACDVPVSHGVILSAILMVGSIVLSFVLPSRFVFILIGYIIVTVMYSLILKRRIVLDVITLGGLYTLRVFGGVAATNIRPSQWLLMFSLFIFLSLALTKRCTELVYRRKAGKTDVMGRGYQVADLALLFPLAAAAGYGAVLIFTLYLSSAEVVALYSYPRRLWLVCPCLLYWISRLLIKANRGELHDDPVVFAITDRVSWLTGLAIAGVVALSI